MKEEINLNPMPIPREKIYLNTTPILQKQFGQESQVAEPTSKLERKDFRNIKKALIGKEVAPEAAEFVQTQVAEPTSRISKEVLLDIRRTLKKQAALGEPTPKIIKVIKKKGRFGR